MGVQQLVEYVRIERGQVAPPRRPDPAARFPGSYGRPLVLGIGMLVVTAVAWATNDVAHLTSDELASFTAAISIGWLPALFLRRRHAFALTAISLLLLSFPLALALLAHYAFVIPIPGLLASVFRPPPRTPDWTTELVLAACIGVLVIATTVGVIVLPPPAM